MGVKGAPGAQAVPYGLERAIEQAVASFGVRKEKVLVGFAEEPPQIDEYDLYIYYSGYSVKFWRHNGCQWVNWCYQW